MNRPAPPCSNKRPLKYNLNSLSSGSSHVTGGRALQTSNGSSRRCRSQTLEGPYWLFNASRASCRQCRRGLPHHCDLLCGSWVPQLILSRYHIFWHPTSPQATQLLLDSYCEGVGSGAFDLSFVTQTNAWNILSGWEGHGSVLVSFSFLVVFF